MGSLLLPSNYQARLAAIKRQQLETQRHIHQHNIQKHVHLTRLTKLNDGVPVKNITVKKNIFKESKVSLQAVIAMKSVGEWVLSRFNNKLVEMIETEEKLHKDNGIYAALQQEMSGNGSSLSDEFRKRASVAKEMKMAVGSRSGLSAEFKKHAAAAGGRKPPYKKQNL